MRFSKMNMAAFVTLAAVVGLAALAFPSPVEAAVGLEHILGNPLSGAAGVPGMDWFGAEGVALAALRKQLKDLEKRAAAKLAEVKTDTPADEAARLEGEHQALLEEIEGVRGQITAKEAEQAEAEVQRRAQPNPESPETPPAPDAEAIRTAANAAVAADRTRAAEIRTLCQTYSMPDDFVQRHIDEGSQVQAVRNAILDELATRSQRNPTFGQVQVGQDETVQRREAMVEYIVARSNRGPMTDRARTMYRGMSAVDLIRETESWHGRSTRGLSADEIAQRGLMATSDFPSILMDVANVTLRAAYEAAPRTFAAWTRPIILPDFRAYHIVRRGETPQLALVNQHGEFKRGTIGESKETIQLKTYGVVVGMTRQMIINDQLGAFAGIPADFATSAASLESDLVYHKLLSNPTLATDSKAVFHADHGNLAGSGAAIGITPLSAGRAAMSVQKGIDGKTVLNVRPNFLLVPPSLESRAEQLLFSPVVAAQDTNAVPPSIRSLTPISEARLESGVSNKDAGVTANGSATAYYLVSTQVDTILIGSLDGQVGPFVETRMGFDIDGVEIKCRHDVAAAAADYRGLYKNPGAAAE